MNRKLLLITQMAAMMAATSAFEEVRPKGKQRQYELSGGNHPSFEPEPGPPIHNPNDVQPLHRFEIKGKVIWAKNKKEALKLANKKP